MWVIIGAVAALLIAVLYFLFNHKKEAAPDFALTNSTAAAGAGGAGAGAAEEDDTDKIKLTLYFGSQTGTAEGFAKTLANESRRAGFKPHIVDLEDFEADDFVADAQEGAMVMFLMATYGEGEPTDNAAEFYEWLKDRDGQLEEGCLQGLKFTVFGLGNRQYEHYNAMGRFVAKRLNALGASEVFASGDGDDDGTLDDDFAAWKETLWPGMQKVCSRTRARVCVDGWLLSERVLTPGVCRRLALLLATLAPRLQVQHPWRIWSGMWRCFVPCRPLRRCGKPTGRCCLAA